MKKSVIRDPIAASDFNQLNLVYCCEQCSFYEEDSDRCNIGYEVHLHKREVQLKSYEISGRMALCRFLEID